jgi:hypothetical protein
MAEYDDERVVLKCRDPGCEAEFTCRVAALSQADSCRCPLCDGPARITHVASRLAGAVMAQLDARDSRRARERQSRITLGLALTVALSLTAILLTSRWARSRVRRNRTAALD